MAKPTLRRARPNRPELAISAASVSGVVKDASVRTVALLVDGATIAFAPVPPGERGTQRQFEFALAPHVLGSVIDVLAVETGRSVLGAPVSLAEARGFRWGDATVSAGRLSGRFALDGPAAPPPGTVIPVELVAGQRLYGRAFAQADAAGIYRFRAALAALPDPGDPAWAAVRVGGIMLQQPLRLGVQECGLAGSVDPSGRLTVQGWAVDLRHPGRRVTVAVRVDGRVIAVATAERMRQDVLALGLGDGCCGFDIPFPPGIPLDREHVVEVVLAGTPTHLVNSPYVQPASPPFLGFFDAVEGGFAGGWLVNMHAPETKLGVEAVCDGVVIGSGMADLYRGDVETAGLPTAQCGFRLRLERPPASLFGRDITVRVAGTAATLSGSPRRVSQNANIARFIARATAIGPATQRRLARRMTYRTRAMLISVIMPVFNTPRDWLIQALSSVCGQWSANWELICIDDGSTAPGVRDVLDEFARRDDRIRILRPPQNGGIARATNFGLRAARGQYVAFMDHDDVIEPDAVYWLADAAITSGADLIYSDEALTTADIDSVIDVRARPAFSHDYYLSHPYFVHMVCVRTTLARQVAGWDETLPISADVDFVLRVLERAGAVAHVPRVLYRWRTHKDSAGHAKQAEVTAATTAALARHLARLGRTATVSAGLGFNQYRVDWPDDGGEVLVVIPTRDRVDLLRPCIESIERTAPDHALRILVIDHQSTDPQTRAYLKQIAGRHIVTPYMGPFNYARMNNVAVREHGGTSKYILFLNNDVEARQPGWIGRLRSLAGRPEVGAVGPLLLYGDDRVQHAGVLMGFSGAADHAMKQVHAYEPGGSRAPGYNSSLVAVRDFSAVTAACLMLRSDVFRSVGGFDEAFAVGFNDTDLCLRIRQAGLKVLYDGATVLYHHESATRRDGRDREHPEDDARLRQRWARYFAEGDPFYSPLLVGSGIDHTLRRDAGCKGQMGVRRVVGHLDRQQA